MSGNNHMHTWKDQLVVDQRLARNRAVDAADCILDPLDDALADITARRRHVISGLPPGGVFRLHAKRPHSKIYKESSLKRVTKFVEQTFTIIVVLTLMAMGILDDLVSDDDQRLLAQCLARVIGQKWGVVELIVENGELKFITVKQSYNATGLSGAQSHVLPPGPPPFPVRGRS